MRRAVIAMLGLLLAASASGVLLEARQPSPPPVIHRVTLLPGDGLLVIEGTGLGDHLVVTVNGQTVTTMPGAGDTRLEAQAPAAVLTTPGTYRLTVADPVRPAWDGFIVASAAAVEAGTVSSGRVADTERGGGAVQAPLPNHPAPPPGGDASFAPRPLTVIEDSGSPFRTAVGSAALSSNTTGTGNTAVGFSALSSNTIGLNNTAVGFFALEDNTGGAGNTAVGAMTLDQNVNGAGNTAVGSGALFFNVGGHNNTAVGAGSLHDSTSANSNTAVGVGAQGSNTTGERNTAVGADSLDSNLSGDDNVAIGFEALLSATGDQSIGLGRGAGANATSGDYNIFIGANVGGTTADANTIRIGLPFSGGIGQNATFISGIRGTTLAGSPDGVYIDAAGRLGSGPVVPANNTVGSAQVIADSLTAADLAAASVGTSEIADGAVSAAKVSFVFAGLGANTFAGTQTIGGGNLELPASSSTAGNLMKNGARFLHDTGIQNTFLGGTSANFTLSGEDNTGLGSQALRNLTAGSNNTGLGSTTLWRTTSGADNTASGYRALFDTTTGSRNTAVGIRAGHNNTTGSDNIYLGADVQGTAADANTTRIGLPYNATTGAGQNKTFVAGIAGTVLTTPAVQVFVDANGQLGTLVPAPITGTVDGTVSANSRPDAALLQELVEQRAVIAELRERLARLEQQVATRPNRR
jgi:hypothetical protein